MDGENRAPRRAACGGLHWTSPMQQIPIPGHATGENAFSGTIVLPSMNCRAQFAESAGVASGRAARGCATLLLPALR
jgi:hypothetical protein